jgi:hypothetical protein
MPIEDGLYRYVEAENVGTFSGLLNKQTDALRASRALQSFRWANAAARTAQTGMRDGDTGLQLDTGMTYTRVSGVWKRSGSQSWIAYTPQITVPGGQNISLGNGSVRAKWKPLDPTTIFLNIYFSVGSTTGFPASGAMGWNLPSGLTIQGDGLETFLNGKIYSAALSANFSAYGMGSDGSVGFIAYSPNSFNNAAELKYTPVDTGRLSVGSNLSLWGHLPVAGL